MKRFHNPKPPVTPAEGQRRANASADKQAPTRRPLAAPSALTPNGSRPAAYEGKPHRMMYRSDVALRKRDAVSKAEAVAAVDAMRAARPLKPPPGRIPEVRASAARLALEADRRLGLVGDWE